MLVQLLISAFGTSWFISQLAFGFLWLKWIGVAYLCYLGVNHLIKAVKKTDAQEVTGLGSFQRGFWVSLTNPKTILFFSAFLPQFVSASQPYLSQIALLSCIFWLLALVLDSGYVFLANKASKIIGEKLAARQNYFSGALYLGASGVLAATEKGS